MGTVKVALGWAANMTWKGLSSSIHLVEGSYPKQVSVLKAELAEYERYWQRSETLLK
mgnify:CR=1 FL=1